MHHFKSNPIAIAILLTSITSILLFKVQETYHLGIFLFLIGIMVTAPLPLQKWTFIDIALGSIICYDIISCFNTSQCIQTILQSFFSVYCMITYLILRRIFSTLDFSQILFKISYIPIGIALLLSFCSFIVFYNSVQNVGFDDTYHFRFLFRPLGYATNVWAEILLILLGWVCLARRFTVFLSFLTTLAILLSFSRGAYIALFVYLLAWTITVKPLKRKLKILAASLAAIIIIAISFPTEMRTALLMNDTVSQQRSTEWRIDAIGSTWEIVKEYPFFGQGNDSYTFAIDRTLNQDSTQNYTSFAPNLPIQLLIEKGFVGTLLYVLLVIAISTYVWKHRHKTNVCIIGCTLLALSVKEMTQATLTSTPFTYFSVFILLALMQKKDENTENSEKQTEHGSILVPGIVLLTYLSAIILNQIQTSNENYCKESFAELNKGNIEKATQLIEETGNQIPYLVQRGILYTECYLKTQELSYAKKAEQSLAKAHKLQLKDVQIIYLQAYLALQKGENDEACFLLTDLATCYPKNSLYLYTLGEAYYLYGKKDKALAYWTDAILYTPRLLAIKRIVELQQTDPLFYNSLKHQLYTLDTSKLSSPIDWACYGYIMHWYGNQPVAEIYLKKAVSVLPNLATPWQLLGQESKYRLLSYGAFQKNISSISVPSKIEMTDKQLLFKAYKAKFKNWYGSSLGGE